jgi:hypothetical protein
MLLILLFVRIYTSDLLSSSATWRDARGSGTDRKREKDRDNLSDSRHEGKKSYFEKPVEEVKELCMLTVFEIQNNSQCRLKIMFRVATCLTAVFSSYDVSIYQEQYDNATK